MRNRIKALLLCLGLAFSTSLQAGGVILYEIGSQDVGFASAGWSARAEDPSTAFTNPAGMSRLSQREIELGVQPVFSNVHFDPNAKTTVKGGKGNGSVWIPAGGLFYVEPINDKWRAGASVLGYFGSKLKFNNGWAGRYYLTELILEGFSFVPAISCRMNEHLSIGIGAQVMYGVFKQKAAVNNSLDKLSDGSLKLYDDDFGFGCIVGVLYEFTPATRIGLQYISQVRLQFRANPEFHHIGPSLQNSLTGTALIDSQVLLDANVPQSLMFSGYHDLTPSLAVMINVGWQEWSRFQKATIVLGTPSQASLTAIPRYKDTWHGAFGVRYKYSCHLALSAGIAYDSAAISTTNRTLDFPVGKQWRYAGGIEWALSDQLQIGLQYTFMWQGNLFVNVNRGPLAGHVEGKYKNTSAQFFNMNAQYIF